MKLRYILIPILISLLVTQAFAKPNNRKRPKMPIPQEIIVAPHPDSGTYTGIYADAGGTIGALQSITKSETLRVGIQKDTENGTWLIHRLYLRYEPPTLPKKISSLYCSGLSEIHLTKAGPAVNGASDFSILLEDVVHPSKPFAEDMYTSFSSLLSGSREFDLSLPPISAIPQGSLIKGEQTYPCLITLGRIGYTNDNLLSSGDLEVSLISLRDSMNSTPIDEYEFFSVDVLPNITLTYFTEENKLLDLPNGAAGVHAPRQQSPFSISPTIPGVSLFYNDNKNR